MSDCPETRMAAEFYQCLNPRELAAVAHACSLRLEDIHQEAWVLCLAIARGQSTHDAALGSVRQHVMGLLWSLTLRWQIPVFLGHVASGDDEESLAPGDVPWEHALCARSPYRPEPEAADPLEIWLVREQEQAYQSACAQTLTRHLESGRLTPGERTFIDLVAAGAPTEELAALYGLTPRAVRYRCDRLRQRLEATGTPPRDGRTPAYTKD